MHEEVGIAVAIRVIGDAFAELLQVRHLRGVESERLNEVRTRDLGEIVAERGNDCPDALASPERAVDENAGAHPRRRVDVMRQPGMLGQRTGVVMVEIFDGDAALEQLEQRVAIDRSGNVERRHGIAACGFDALEQLDLALGAGDQHGVDRHRQP